MLAEDKLKILKDLISNSSSEEIAWMNGYIRAPILECTAVHGATWPCDNFRPAPPFRLGGRSYMRESLNLMVVWSKKTAI